MIYRSLLLSVMLIAASVNSCGKGQDTVAKPERPKAIVLYSSGDPEAVVPALNMTVDVVTSPTPKLVNTEFVARCIAQALEDSNVSVVLKRTEDLKSPREVLAADIIVIGSSTHFWNMDWQTKRLFDEVLYPIYVHRKQKLKDKMATCFTTSEIEPSGRQCLESINRAFGDFGAQVLRGLIITDNTPPDKVKRKVTYFCRNILDSLIGKVLQ